VEGAQNETHGGTAWEDCAGDGWVWDLKQKKSKLEKINMKNYRKTLRGNECTYIDRFLCQSKQLYCVEMAYESGTEKLNYLHLNC
jgi:hypothetical protein